MRIAFLYEHPTWSDQLLTVLQRRIPGIVPVNVAELRFDTDTNSCGFSAAINRINIMPSADRLPQVVFQTQHYLSWLEQSGVRMINGSRAHAIGSSKAMQNGVFSSLNLAYPSGIAIYRQEDAINAAEQIGYPAIVKPNIGGSGSGISLYQNRAELEQAVQIKALDLGVDRTGIVQQYIRSDGFVYRVEVLGDALFYSIKQPVVAGEFNYCSAEGCSTDDPEQTVSTEQRATEGGDFDFCVLNNDAGGIQTHNPAPTVVDNVVRIIKASGADFGGVEYFIDTDTGQPCYYDFNPYSNFVSDGENLLGFSPEERFADFVCQILKGDS
jgi:D-alanine-D-alanine ligase-like ATP-grasp enzyme